ncbi:MAG: hypothetical protein PHO32_04620 [Candidatus Cloacimonetes bacterium]|nr:hypothetical protein [Candidatus Cloacimonadota bacterium]
MKENKARHFKGSISSIIRISVDEGGGLLGFTIAYSEDNFENVVMSFLPVDYDIIWAELNHKRKELIRKMNTKGRTK